MRVGSEGSRSANDSISNDRSSPLNRGKHNNDYQNIPQIRKGSVCAGIMLFSQKIQENNYKRGATQKQQICPNVVVPGESLSYANKLSYQV